MKQFTLLREKNKSVCGLSPMLNAHFNPTEHNISGLWQIMIPFNESKI